MKQEAESVWVRLVKSCMRWRVPGGIKAPKVPPVRLDEAAADANTRVLERLRVDDPTYLAVLDHAAAQFAREIEAALDPALPDGVRVGHLNGARAVRAWLEDFEFRRQACNEDREQREKKA